MTNYQKYEKEIIEILGDIDDIALSKSTKRPIGCSFSNCQDCAFNDRQLDCGKMRAKWLSAKYKEPIMLTDFEKEVLKRALKTDYKYIARDKSNKLFLYKEMPWKTTFLTWSSGIYLSLDFLKDDFKFVKWEDDEPRSIEELLTE